MSWSKVWYILWYPFHRVIHWLGFQTENVSTHKQGDKTIISFKCPWCGEENCLHY